MRRPLASWMIAFALGASLGMGFGLSWPRGAANGSLPPQYLVSEEIAQDRDTFAAAYVHLRETVTLAESGRVPPYCVQAAYGLASRRAASRREAAQLQALEERAAAFLSH